MQAMDRQVVITGIGMVTPLGQDPSNVLDRIGAGDRALATPSFDAGGFACRHCASVDDFDIEPFFPENKTLRLMNRDAQMAVVAAHLAMQDAGIRPDETYPSDQIGLFGATGVTSLPIEEAKRLVQLATDERGQFDVSRFGRDTLKRTRPVLSFKILANMPICFVSIFEGIRGPNAVYTPWESQAAQAIIAGIEAIRRGEASCVVVGGCDVKTRLMSFLALEQLGIFETWKRNGHDFVPGEGAAFMVLEDEQSAKRRSARCYARIGGYQRYWIAPNDGEKPTCGSVPHDFSCTRETALIAGEEPDAAYSQDLDRHLILRPKTHLGNLFAAAAAVQLGLGASLFAREPGLNRVVARCCGFDSELTTFLLEAL